MWGEHYVGAYWLARSESAESCARRMETFLKALGACDPRLVRWFKKGKTLEEAQAVSIEPDAALIKRMFHQQEHQDGRFKSQGYSLALWSGQTHEEASSLSLSCGEGHELFPNNCLLSPPEDGVAAEHMLQATMVMRILATMVVAWEPEWGVATSHAHRDLMDSPWAGTFVGWVTYFSRRRGPLPPLPEPVRIEPVGDLGSLVLLTPERLSASNPAHVALAREVTARLSDAGLIHDLRPCDA